MVQLAEYQLSQSQGEAAFSWLNLAARWCDPNAIARLQGMGAPVPTADLALAQQQQQSHVQAVIGQAIGEAIGCSLAGGCRQSGSGALPPPDPPKPRRPIRCTSTLMKDMNGNPTYECR